MLAEIEATTFAPFAAAGLLGAVGLVHSAGFLGAGSIGGGSAARAGIAGVNALLSIALLAMSAVIAFQAIHWSVAVATLGSAFLLAPFLVQPLPPALRDGAAGLALFAGLALAALYTAGAAGVRF